MCQQTMGTWTQKRRLLVGYMWLYPSTGNVMAQGSCYLLWHVEHLPMISQRLLEMDDECLTIDKDTISKASDHDLEILESHSCSVCSERNTADMVACNACSNWLHYPCTKLFPLPELHASTFDEDAVFVCWQCASNEPMLALTAPTASTEIACQTENAQQPTDPQTEPPGKSEHRSVQCSDAANQTDCSGSVGALDKIMQVMTSMENNITEAIESSHPQIQRLLSDKFAADLQAEREKQQTQLNNMSLRDKEELLQQQLKQQSLRHELDKYKVVADVKVLELQNQLRDAKHRINYLETSNRSFDENVRIMTTDLVKAHVNLQVLSTQNHKLSARLWSLHRTSEILSTNGDHEDWSISGYDSLSPPGPTPGTANAPSPPAPTPGMPNMPNMNCDPLVARSTDITTRVVDGTANTAVPPMVVLSQHKAQHTIPDNVNQKADTPPPPPPPPPPPRRP